WRLPDPPVASDTSTSAPPPSLLASSDELAAPPLNPASGRALGERQLARGGTAHGIRCGRRESGTAPRTAGLGCRHRDVTARGGSTRGRLGLSAGSSALDALATDRLGEDRHPGAALIVSFGVRD